MDFSASSAPIDLPEWKDKRYLLIDDFPGMRQLLRESLRNMGARLVDQADSGGEAMSLLSRNRYDVVLCDYNLGQGKNGQQVLEETQVRNLLLPTAIWMMVSAEKGVESVMGAAEHQPDAYVIKPITEQVLITRLNRAWARKQIFKPIDQAYAEKDYLRAAKLCDIQISTNKLHELDLLRMKATLLMKAGEIVMAREVYERVMKAREFSWAKAGLAKIKLKEGELESARLMFQEVIADNQYYIEAYDQLAATHQQLGQLEEAAKTLERAAKLSPNSISRQRNLGDLSLKLGNTAMAEKAFRKCLQVGEHSALKTPDAYLGLARVCGMKNEPKEALSLLATMQKEFTDSGLRVRSKITEGLVYHESGDYRNARKAGDELGEMLDATLERPDPVTCLDMARLLFAVGVKEMPEKLLCEVVRNNHDNLSLLAEAQQIFEKARMGEEGEDMIAQARKEANDLMNRGVLLWKTGKLREAIDWMRTARTKLPSNQRILFNFAQIIVSSLQENGYNQALADEAKDLLLNVDRIAPGQQRFAQLMETLIALAPDLPEEEEGADQAEGGQDDEAA
ncbi:MAG TPA: tetratricopeptide repeat protein [Burkholderiaceae bacterium]